MDEKLTKYLCPYCGHPSSITYIEGAESKGTFMRCKGRHCGKVYEIKLPLPKTKQ